MMHYPKTQRAAGKLAGALHGLIRQRSANTEVATVVDTTSQLTYGYVLATSSQGSVRVFGCPLNGLVAGMWIYIRQINLNSYVYDGMAAVTPPNAGLNTISRAICYDGSSAGYPAAVTEWQRNLAIGSSGPPSQNDPTVFWQLPNIAVPGFPSVLDGFFWSCFFCMTALPNPGTQAVLFDMALLDTNSNITGGFQITYDWQAHLNAQFYGASWGNPTASLPTPESFAPHKIWWLAFQIRNGQQINGLQTSTVLPHLNGQYQLKPGYYAVSLLGDVNGASTPPIGSWVSQILCGYGNPGGVATWPFTANVGFTPNSIPSVLSIQSNIAVANTFLSILNFVPAAIPANSGMDHSTIFNPGPIPNVITSYEGGAYGVSYYRGDNAAQSTYNSLPVYGTVLNTGAF